MRTWTAGLTATLVLALGAGSGRAETPKATYDKMCASCHGADGHGNAGKAKVLKIEPKLLDLGRAEAKTLSRDDKRKALVDGKEKMPGYGKKIAAAEIDPLLDYSLSLAGGGAAPAAPAAPAVPKAGSAAAPATGAAVDVKKAKPLWTKSCAGCHGADGAGKAAKAKSLKIDAATLDLGRDEASGMSRDDLRAAIEKGKGKMPAYAKKLKPAQIDLLADYAKQLAEAIRAKRKK